MKTIQCTCGNFMDVKNRHDEIKIDGKTVNRVKWFCKCDSCGFKTKESLTKAGAIKYAFDALTKKEGSIYGRNETNETGTGNRDTTKQKTKKKKTAESKEDSEEA